MKSINWFLDNVYYPFVKYRLHISLIFLFLLVNIFTNFAKQSIDWPVVISFFLWHYALYLFDRAYDFELDNINQPKEAIQSSERNILLYFTFFLAVLPVAVLLVSGRSCLPYLPFIPITFLYTFPIYKKLRSKNLLFFKNLYSALFIWTLPLAVVFFFYTDTTLPFWSIFKTYFLGLFIYVLIGEAFWDIRDVSGDSTQGVNTIPVVLGVPFTKVYLLLLILIDYLFFGNVVTSSTIVYVFLILIVNQYSPPWLFHIPPLLALYRFLSAML